MHDNITSSISEHATRTERATPRRLPAELTPLIGREREVDLLCGLLSNPQTRLFTLLGPGGVGKTRLALHVAIHMQHMFRDGVYFVPLAMIREPSMVVPALGQALRLQESRGLPLLEQMQIALQDKHTLLLLDNFEHVVQTAPFLEELLLACPSLTILVTSREVLHLRAEQQFPISPLPLPELSPSADHEDLAQNPAVALFLARAQAIEPTFQLTPANAGAVATICISLDGLPLALELAAARIKTLSPQALLTRLSQRFALLTAGPITLPEHQQTLRNTLQWSYDLLNSQEQWLYRLLSVFVGGCTLEALEAVAETLTGQNTSLLDGVTALVDKSLLVSLAQRGEEPHFMMLETVREYGLACLREHGESEISQQAHAHYYLTLAEQADTHLKGAGQQVTWLKRMVLDQANLRAALSWFLEQQDAQSLLQLSGALRWYWTIRGLRNEALEWLHAAFQLPGAEAPTAARARALCGAGFLTTYLHNRRQEGLALLEESLSLYQHLRDTQGLAETCGWYAQALIYEKDYHAARMLAEQGIAFSKTVGEQRFAAFNHSMLAIVVEKEGDEAEAVRQWEHSLTLALELDEHAGLATRARKHLASLAFARGNEVHAKALLEENLALAREAGYTGTIYWSLAGLADLARLQGHNTQANALCTEGLALARETGDRYAISRLLATQGHIAQAQGKHEQAVVCYREGLSLAATIDAREAIGHSLLGLAREALAADDLSQATRLFAAATQHLTLDRQLAPVERTTYERDLARLHARLDAAAFAIAWTEGESMTPQQALSFPYVRQHKEASSSILDPVRADPIHGNKQSSRSPDGLTAREVEVLLLVAQGWTDAQIAEKLVISTRTVNAHLTSIYRKIRVSSRHAAAHYTRTHHLP